MRYRKQFVLLVNKTLCTVELHACAGTGVRTFFEYAYLIGGDFSASKELVHQQIFSL